MKFSHPRNNRAVFLILPLFAAFLAWMPISLSPVFSFGPSTGRFVSTRVLDEEREQRKENRRREIEDSLVPGEIRDTIFDEETDGNGEKEDGTQTGEVSKGGRGVGGAGYFPSLSIFGQSGYIFVPSVEVAQSNHPVTYGSATSLSSEDIDITLATTGMTWSPARNLELGWTWSKMNFKSPHELGYMIGPVDLDATASSVSLKYLALRPAGKERVNWDNALAVGMVVPVDTFDELSAPVQNVLNVIRDTFVGKSLQPTFTLAYGGFDMKNRYSVTLFTAIGDAFSMGVGFRTNLLDMADLAVEYLTTLNDINGVQIDNNQYGIKFMVPIGYGVRFQAYYSYMDINFAGPELERFANRFDMYGAGLEAKF